MKQQAKKKFKGCLIQDHKDENTIFLCVSPNCQSESRLLCLDCCIERKKHHSECENYLLKYQELLGQIDDPFQISNWIKNTQIQNINKNIADGKSDEKIIQEIDVLFANIQESIINNINQLKSKIKDQVLKNKVTLNKEQPQVKNGIQELQDLSPLSNALVQYNENQISIQQLHSMVLEFSKNKEIEKKEKAILELYQSFVLSQNIQEINYNNLIALEDELLKCIQQNEDKIIYSNRLAKVNFLPIKGCENSCQVIDNCLYAAHANALKNNYSNFQSTQAFERDQEVKFQFQLQQKPGNNCFYIGIAPEIIQQSSFWFNYGNQVNLLQENQSNIQGSYKLTGKNFNQVWNQDKIFQMNINVSQNKIRFNDLYGEYILENTAVLPNIQKWRIVFGSQSGNCFYKLAII